MTGDASIDTVGTGAGCRTADESRGAASRVRFAEFELDLDRGELWRDGTRCPLRPMATAALCLLIENRHRLVTRDELRRRLWGDTAVEWETGLHQVIRQLRRALGDDAGPGGFIVTVPRRGYAWVAPLRRAEPEAVVPRASSSLPDHAARVLEPRWRSEKWRKAGLFLAGIATLPLGLLVFCLLAQL